MNFDLQGKKLFLLPCFPWLVPNHERGLWFLGPCQQEQRPRESREERSRGPGCLDNLMLQGCPKVKVSAAQSCLTLCDPMDCSLPVSVHGILQTRILEWVAMSFSRGSSQPWDRTQVSCLEGWSLYHLSHQGSPRSPAGPPLAALELPASLSWETHTSFLPVRPVVLGFGCTE